MAVHLLAAGRGIEYVANHVGHRNIRHIRVYAQITNPWRAQVFRGKRSRGKLVENQ